MHWASNSPRAAYAEHVRDNLAGKAMETSWFAERPVGELRPGDHAWLAFGTREEREDVIDAFVQDALAGVEPEKVVYVTDAPPDDLPGVRPRDGVDLRARTRSNQLRVIPREQACLDRHGRFDPDRMLDTLAREVEQADGQGFRAVRLTTDFSWLLTGPHRGDLERMLCCEHMFDETVSPSTMAMAICQVDRAACPPEQLAALRDTHEVLVEVNPQFNDGILKIVRTYDPPGLRVEGELDAARHQVFAQELALVTASRRRAHLDFSRLGFIDLAGLNLLALHATGLPGGGPLVLDNLPPDVENVIEMVGWHRLPGLARGRLHPRSEAESAVGGTAS